MSTATPTLIRDLAALWNHESRSFLRYLVEESSPVSVDARDADILAGFAKIHDLEDAIAERLVEMWDELGLSPDPPCYELSFGAFNYMTPRSLAARYRGIADREIAELDEMVARHAGESGSGARLQDIAAALIEVRRAGRERLGGLACFSTDEPEGAEGETTCPKGDPGRSSP